MRAMGRSFRSGSRQLSTIAVAFGRGSGERRARAFLYQAVETGEQPRIGLEIVSPGALAENKPNSTMVLGPAAAIEFADRLQERLGVLGASQEMADSCSGRTRHRAAGRAIAFNAIVCHKQGSHAGERPAVVRGGDP